MWTKKNIVFHAEKKRTKTEKSGQKPDTVYLQLFNLIVTSAESRASSKSRQLLQQELFRLLNFHNNITLIFKSKLILMDLIDFNVT